jgi:hypothetical protein
MDTTTREEVRQRAAGQCEYCHVALRQQLMDQGLFPS